MTSSRVRRILTPTGALRAWWALAMIVVMSIVTAGVCIFYTAHQQRTSDQRWCQLMVSLDDPQIPPPNERARVIEQELHDLRHKFGCH